jgi:AbrB family looped-hinge helix DNA binding protein
MPKPQGAKRGTRGGREKNRLVRYASAASSRAVIDQGGRIVIPAEMRRALGLAPGDTVEMRVDGEALRVRSLAGAVREAQAAVERRVPKGTRLVDELLSERRGEVDDA